MYTPNQSISFGKSTETTEFLRSRLQYRDDEKGLVVMHNVFQGAKGGRRMTLVTDLVMEWDLGSRLSAMSMGSATRRLSGPR